ncbi:MAG: hypothetical protein HDR15_03100 [Lachnospiraceae bacterium]|nr:hypothetical protein [Lachnospiraceae bacterium]
MDMMDIVTDYQQLNQVQTQDVNSTWKAVSNAAKAAESAETEDKTAAFAEALKTEIDNLQQRNELETALGDSSLLGVTENLNNVSEMLKTESGRQAIGALADNAMASIVFGTNNSDQNSLLRSMTQVNTSEQSLEEALKDVLEILESKGASDQMEDE